MNPASEKESFRWIDSLRNSTERLNDSQRLVHIGDREADIYEFFHEAEKLGSNYLVRIKVDRRLAPKSTTLRQELEKSISRGTGEISYTDKDGSEVKVILDIKFIRTTIKPSDGLKRKRYDERNVTVIQAKEISKSGGNRDPIDWRIMTNLPVSNLEEALEKLHWYSLRWKIEYFHRILKSGFGVEEARLGNRQRLENLLCLRRRTRHAPL